MSEHLSRHSRPLSRSLTRFASFLLGSWDWSKASPPPGMNWGNCRIENASVAAQWQAEMSKGHYFHARSKADTLKGLGITAL